MLHSPTMGLPFRRYFFISSLLIIFGLSFPAGSAAEFLTDIGGIHSESVSNGEFQGNTLVLRGVKNGSITIPLNTPLDGAKFDKLSFKIEGDIPSAPVLRWHVRGKNRWFGYMTTFQRDGAYLALTRSDPTWTGEIDALSLVFNFQSEKVGITLPIEAGKTGYPDRMFQVLATEPISPWSIHLLSGYYFLGFPLAKFLGLIFLLSSLVLFLLVRDKKKLAMTAPFMLAIFWLGYDVRFDLDIWRNFLHARRDAAAGTYFNTADIYPFVDFVRKNLPAQKTTVEYVGPAYPQRQFLTYLLLPHRVVERPSTAPYIAVYGTKLEARGDSVFAGENMVCSDCSIAASFDSDSHLLKRGAAK